MNVKTVVIVNDFNYIQGGASKVAIDTARMLNECGLNVCFFSAVNKNKENIEGITYVSTNQSEALKEKNKIKGAINGIYNLKAKRKLKELLKRLNPEDTIIHVHGWTKALSSSIFDIAFKMKFRVVLTLHDYFTACPNGGYFNYKQNKICNLQPLSRKCIKCNCDSRNYGFKLYRIVRQFVQNKIVKLNDKLEYVISISNFSEKILKTTLGKNVKITRIYNPIENDNNYQVIDTSKNQYFLYVGRISREKGTEIFCQAITELGYKGVVVGDGEQKEILEKKYSNIEFTGWKNKDEVKEYMKGAKALIFPSIWYEGAPLTTIEAYSIGLPCIVSDKCAASEFAINNENGILYNGTIKGLKEKILEYNEKFDREQVSKSTYDSYLKFNFSKEEYVKKLMEYYKKILQ